MQFCSLDSRNELVVFIERLTESDDVVDQVVQALNRAAPPVTV